MTTSDKIRELMEERGLTQQQFAGLVGIHHITLNKNLINDNFSSKSLEKIASACGVSVYDLVPDKEASNITLSNVCGYLECNGEIVKIRDLKTLKKFVARIDTQERLMKLKQTKLPKQQPITLDNIILDNWEEYDATQMEVMSFRHHYDIVNGEQFNVGNMCAGYPFQLNGITFQNSEAAYIAGIYSLNNPEHTRLQRALEVIEDGYRAKKEYRHKRYNHIKRHDWEEFNIEWMKYVVWNKCKGNQSFAKLLKSIPETAMVVENSTGMTGATAQVWGCFNSDLEELRNAKVRRYAIENSIKKESDERLNKERNRWNNYGVWSGKNLMGKIIKMCSICLQKGIELPIDYELLKSKHIHLFGQELQFTLLKADTSPKALILDFDMTLFNTRPSIQARLAKDWDKAFEQIPNFILYDGWRDVFDYVKSHGIKTILISQATKKLMQRTMEHFDLSCDIIIGSRVGYPSKKNKNNAILIDMALKELGADIPKQNIISIGDSDTDRRMSEGAGVRFVGAIWDCEKDESLTELQHGEVISDPKEIIHILESVL
jgi:transcriptional regulator with XRE-family HTH domain/FMN phosphatase YigB (HAD superfamily)